MLESIKSLLNRNKTKKNKSMQEALKTISEKEKMYSNLDFQWIKGDKIGNIEKFEKIFDNGENTFIQFKSGERINEILLDEWIYTFPASPTDLTANASPEKKVELASPKAIPNSSVSEISYVETNTNKDVDSPIYKLLKKQKENMVDVSIKIKMNLPQKELYSVLITSFDDAEKEIIDFILDTIDIEDIKKSLAASIKKSYYTGNEPKSSKSSNT
jgi:hypothetical protein